MNFAKSLFPRGIYLLGIAIVSTIATWAMVFSPYRDTSLFYIAMPFLISFAIYWTASKPAAAKFARQTFGRHMLEAAAIFFLIALFMFEGFICVLFSAPIYFAAASLGYMASYSVSGAKYRKRNRFNSYALPVIAVILSLEGVSAATTLDRENKVTYTTTVDASIDDLKANMAKPITFDQPRQWFISLFPSPVRVEAGSLNVGDIHNISFVYKRWFFTNIQTGDMRLRIDSVDDDSVETTIVENTSYLASYMMIEGTRVQFRELGSGRTNISLTLFYKRKLDPVWYFGPLQRFAMSESARYLVETVIARTHLDG